MELTKKETNLMKILQRLGDSKEEAIKTVIDERNLPKNKVDISNSPYYI